MDAAHPTSESWRVLETRSPQSADQCSRAQAAFVISAAASSVSPSHEKHVL
jgi:hypothetical protein